MISLQNISKSFAEKDLYVDLNFRIDAGDHIGMIGGNGTGKTTLARIIVGTESADNGIVNRSKSWSIGYLRQEVEQVDEQILHDFVESGKPALVTARVALEKHEQIISTDTSDAAMMAYAEALSHFEEAGGYVVEAEVDRILTGLGFTPGETKRKVKTLSGGWIMRAALARLLFQEPELLILDEPTNHLDLPALTWLEGFLKEWKGAYLVISHDRTFLNTMVNKIVELEQGVAEVYAGNFDYYLEQKELRREIKEATLKNQEQRIAQVTRFIEKYKADKSRARQAGSRKKMLKTLEAELVDVPRRKRRIHFTFPQPERGGTPAMKLEHINKSYGDILVYESMNFQINRGEKIALVGPNGAGKSTLLKICADVVDFQSGERSLGHNTEMHYYAQHQLDQLNPEQTPLGEMSKLPNWDKMTYLRGLLAALLLGEKEIETKVGDLSGGEKAKLAIAKMLLKPANLIMMDEPTNHLDPQAREVLEDALTKFEGSLIFISHDRTFINNIATKVIEVVDGQLYEYSGNYDDYMMMKEKERTGLAPKKQLSVAKPVTSKSKKAKPKAQEQRLSKEEEKERKRQDAAHRSQRKKVLNGLQNDLKAIEKKIALTETKISEIHKEYSKPDLPADKFASLGKESTALNQFLADLYEQWEAAAEKLELAKADFV